MRKVRDILRDKGTRVESIAPDQTVYEALGIMAEKNIGALLVLKDKRIIGLISERDYARKVILKGKRSQDLLVSEIMTTEVITVDPDKNLEECMELLTHKRVRHLPVIENEQVAGIISIGDIVKGIITHKQFVIEQLEDYIKGWK